jgi:tetratricopeptide (TPR) repeat protein
MKRANRWKEAENALREALPIAEGLVSESPTVHYHRGRLAQIQARLSDVLQSSELAAEAEHACRRSIAMFEQLMEEFPDVAAAAGYAQDLGHAYFRLGSILLADQRHDGAEAAYGRALDLFQTLSRASPDRWCLPGGFHQLGILRSSAGSPQQAAEAFRQAREHYEMLIEESTTNTDVPLVSCLNNLAWLLATCPQADLRDPVRAVELARKAVELDPQWICAWNTLGPAHYRATWTDGLLHSGTSAWNTLSAALVRTGEWNLAIEALGKSMHVNGGGNSFDWFFLAMAHRQLGDREQARHWFDRGVEWMDKNMPGDLELVTIRSEAAELLGLPAQFSQAR